MKRTLHLPRIASLAPAVLLFVLVGCASSRYERSTGEYFDDKMLGNRVKHALNAQPVYKYPDVKVNTFRGVVQLSGFVASEPQREAATEIAQRVRGVGEVENDIVVAPLERVQVRDYIPGRNDNPPGSTGAAPRNDRTTSGSVTNSNTSTNIVR
jgi:hyperosmotically inducible periplasmic protein